MKDTIIEMENFNYDKISTVMKITMIILVIWALILWAKYATRLIQ
jgi:hypothetical protein